MNVRIKQSLPIILTIAGVSFTLTTAHTSLIGALFVLTVTFLMLDRSSDPRKLAVFLGALLLLVNFTYLLPIPNDEIAIYFYCIFSLIYVLKISKPKNLLGLLSYRHSIIFFALTFFLWLFSNSQQWYKMVMHAIFNMGYDQVGHFAIMRTLSRCNEHLYLCDTNSSLLPLNYMFYPQQWHILLSRFVSDGDMISILGSYIFFVVVSTSISLFFLHFSINVFTRGITGIRFKNYPNLSVSKVVLQSTVYLLILILSFLGYPNFVFATALFVFAVATYERNVPSSYVLLSLILIISVSMYTLFLVPGIALFLLATIFSRGSIALKAMATLTWGIFSYSVVALAREKNHVDFIGTGGGGLSLVVITTELILLTGLLINLLQAKRKEIDFKSSIGNLVTANATVFMSLIGLNVLLVLMGNTTGYYLAKFSYFAVIVGLVNLFIGLSQIKFKIPNPKVTATSVCLMIAVIWYLIPRVPFTSPFVNVVNTFMGPSEIEKARIANVYSAAMLSEAAKKPVVLLSTNSGPDTQWANSLSGNWSAYLNSYLENKFDNELEFRDPKFQASNKEFFVFYDTERK